jgi:hypothetical protein
MAEFFSNLAFIFSVASDIWYIVLPPILYFLFMLLWGDYVGGKAASKMEWVLLEIIPPREVERSPHPMELIFSGLSGVIKSPSAVEEYVTGDIPASFSLEIVGTEGKAHFYIRTLKGFRNLVEAHFYAQYPDVEIVEVDDYVKAIPSSVPNMEWDMWGVEFKLLKPDLYPIRTYKFFEESVTGKMIDPLAGLIEVIGKAPPGQHMWLQLIMTPQKEDWGPKKGQATIEEFLGHEKVESPGVFSRLWHDFSEIFANIFTAILGKEIEWTALGEAPSKDEAPVEFRLTPGQKDVLKALESNIGKPMYKIKMRYMYVGRREGFSKQTGVSAFIGGIKQFNDLSLNSMVPDDLTKTYANYIWVDKRTRYRQRKLFRRYITRDSDDQSNRFLLSSEELATLFHIPDMAVVAPSLTRVVAKRGGAPANLPVQ